jgi:hypothetical protein
MVIIDEQLAARFWPNADPIGRRMYLPQRPEDVERPGPDAVWLSIVRVVGNVKLRGLVEGEGLPPRAARHASIRSSRSRSSNNFVAFVSFVVAKKAYRSIPINSMSKTSIPRGDPASPL